MVECPDCRKPVAEGSAACAACGADLRAPAERATTPPGAPWPEERRALVVVSDPSVTVEPAPADPQPWPQAPPQSWPQVPPQWRHPPAPPFHPPHPLA
ncbi:hypothetical protein KCV87_19865 [Actinosynnema pretiosum subsp. pretiosum]|uniref:Zinc ribbon domain-containing protein n=1 Tax=Actinosynnema pretiosum subsp. pretiosum TaxID=103721 RepID=A0AA45L1N7_9PSEU|nr:hypothetical protein APASM_0120 [Actinosynnema pretiosum subsp. pretiosum]QUF01799.1 hypothetical protein KCV87_19865 [Actinosynnema pretiosum subsp. pretiosum]